MLIRTFWTIFLGASLLTQAGCHTTRLGKSIGYPSPSERAQSLGY